ncbi:MAG: hypothetical protein ABID04_02430 [Patescibacteria group bacterium]
MNKKTLSIKDLADFYQTSISKRLERELSEALVGSKQEKKDQLLKLFLETSRQQSPFEPRTGGYSRHFLAGFLEFLVGDGKDRPGFPKELGGIFFDLNSLKDWNDLNKRLASGVILIAAFVLMKVADRFGGIMVVTGGDDFLLLFSQTEKKFLSQVLEQVFKELNQVSTDDFRRGIVAGRKLSYFSGQEAKWPQTEKDLAVLEMIDQALKVGKIKRNSLAYFKVLRKRVFVDNEWFSLIADKTAQIKTLSALSAFYCFLGWIFPPSLATASGIFDLALVKSGRHKDRKELHQPFWDWIMALDNQIGQQKIDDRQRQRKENSRAVKFFARQ